MTDDLWQSYSKKCRIVAREGTENSFYTPFEVLLETYFPKEENYSVINNPQAKREHGHPDFQIKKEEIPVVNIEAKPPNKDIIAWLKNPKSNEESKRLFHQIKKYQVYNNIVILVTDFKTIWWIDTASISDRTDRNNTITEVPILYSFSILDDGLNLTSNYKEEWDRLINLLKLDADKAKSGIMTLLENIMPHIKQLRSELERIMDGTIDERKEGDLREFLIEVRSDLKKTLFSRKRDFKEQFFDLYTQLIAYGMFMAWLRYHKNRKRRMNFHIHTVSNFLPRNSLLQNLFNGICNNIPDPLYDTVFVPIQKWFNRTEYVNIAFQMNELMNEFYSGFLEKYDKELKKNMGVVYTPKEVVDFTIRNINYLLKTKFDINNGILNRKINFLDPAAGTMAYPCSLMKIAYQMISNRVDKDPGSFGTDAEKQKKFNDWFRHSFLRKKQGFGNVFGFEILMSPYILGAIRTLMMAEKLGAKVDYKLDTPQLYLLNTLMDKPESKSIPEFLEPLNNKNVKNELEEGLKVRKKKNIMVVMGNPPYNVSSQNSSDWITEKVNDYIKEENMKREEGKPSIKEIRGLKSSKDDYWKFIRFAQYKIADEGNKGIVAYITNNFYIDGLTARGMRKELRKKFNEIYIINLHGDWKKEIPERVDETVDENIFGINCGVAIIFMIRYNEDQYQYHKRNDPYRCEVRYTELWGTSIEKLNFLNDNSIETLDFEVVGKNYDWELTPYTQTDATYSEFPYLYDIFYENIQGIVTGKDSLVSSQDYELLKEKITLFYTEKFREYDRFQEHTFVDTDGNKTKGHKFVWKDIRFADGRDWKIENALKTGSLDEALDSIITWQYRGFDYRFIAYYQPLLNNGTERFSLMQYLLPHQNNVTLIVNRQSGKIKKLPSSYFISTRIFEHKCNEGASGLDSYAFPLKVNLTNKEDNFEKPKLAIHYNIRSSFMKQLPYWNWKKLQKEEINKSYRKVFYYIYGILYSPRYRRSYKRLLEKDFPRVPFPRTKATFERMARLGRKLASCHLMTDAETRKVKRKETNLDKIDMVKGSFSVKVGKRRRWIPYKNNPFTRDGIKNMGVICFQTKSRTKDGIRYDTPVDSYLKIHNIPKEVWEFEIGGRQQLDDWLLSRRYNKIKKKNYLNRGLNKEELQYFIRIINAIEDTLALQPKIDEVYQEVIANLIPSLSHIKKTKKILQEFF